MLMLMIRAFEEFGRSAMFETTGKSDHSKYYEGCNASLPWINVLLNISISPFSILVQRLTSPLP